MNSDYIYNLCLEQEWDKVREYLLASEASNEDKKKQICNREGGQVPYSSSSTCLYWACTSKTPRDILIALLDMG